MVRKFCEIDAWCSTIESRDTGIATAFKIQISIQFVQFINVVGGIKMLTFDFTPRPILERCCGSFRQLPPDTGVLFHWHLGGHLAFSYFQLSTFHQMMSYPRFEWWYTRLLVCNCLLSVLVSNHNHRKLGFTTQHMLRWPWKRTHILASSRSLSLSIHRYHNLTWMNEMTVSTA